MSGPWNIMNGIAGILNIVTICGWFGIFISKDSSKDMIWPDMIWAWIIAYDLWNFAYTYNCISDHSAYAGLALLLACTIPRSHQEGRLVAASRADAGAVDHVRDDRSAVRRCAGRHSHHAQPYGVFAVSFLALASNVALAAYQSVRSASSS